MKVSCKKNCCTIFRSKRFEKISQQLLHEKRNNIILKNVTLKDDTLLKKNKLKEFGKFLKK